MQALYDKYFFSFRRTPVCVSKFTVSKYNQGMLQVYAVIRKWQKTLVDAHKHVFGPQCYCFVGIHRYWVWDFGTWVVNVSNIKGIIIEVDDSVSLNSAFDIIKWYCAQFGVK